MKLAQIAEELTTAQNIAGLGSFTYDMENNNSNEYFSTRIKDLKYLNINKYTSKFISIITYIFKLIIFLTFPFIAIIYFLL